MALRRRGARGLRVAGRAGIRGPAGIQGGLDAREVPRRTWWLPGRMPSKVRVIAAG
jgi:hypothetical protein